TLPALVFVGLPPVVANATGTVALLPGYVSGAWGFREDLQSPAGLTMTRMATLSLAGGAAGAVLLLFTDDRIFRVLIPWLLLVATALFAIGPTIVRRTRTREGGTPSRGRASFGVVLVAVYGGYFNGGLGILLLALFGLLGQSNLHAANGSKNVVSALLTAIAVLVYAFGGLVAWPQALVMMVAATAGGYFGARMARRLSPHVLRAGIVGIGLVMLPFSLFGVEAVDSYAVPRLRSAKCG
ncbi:MAG: sulfite exporter TauE/SafE family protein, partial [Burkholderiaceae bacterium]